jgi:hypothetical protein
MTSSVGDRISKVTILFVVLALTVGLWACSSKPSEQVIVGAPIGLTEHPVWPSATPTP